MNIISVPSAPPQEVKQRLVSSTSIRITWNSPPLTEQNGVIRHYKINLTSPNGGVTIRNTSLMETLFTELHPYSSYIISVAAVTIASGPFSSIIKVSTLQDGNVNNRCITTYIYSLTLNMQLLVDHHRVCGPLPCHPLH